MRLVAHLLPSLNSYVGDGVHLQDTADTRSGTVVENSDITGFTPWGTPWVLNDEVVLSILGTITNGKHCMVKACTAIRGWEDTTLVESEWAWTGSNGNGDWLLSNSGSKSSVTVLGNVGISSGTNNTLWSGVFTGLLSASVWVGIEWLEFSWFEIVEHISHKTTSATGITVAAGAINQLLHWEIGERSVLEDLVGTFHSSGTWEWPAWTTWSLVLNWGDSTFLSPVLWSWDWSLCEKWFVFVQGINFLFFIVIKVIFNLFETHSLLIFLVTHICELVELKLEVWVLSVVLLNEVVVLFEDTETGLIFFFC